MLKGRNKQVYLSLKQKPQGLTVIEAMELGLGTEMRKVCSTLIRLGYNIEKKPETKGNRHWIRYILVEQPRVMTIIDPMSGEKQEILIK